jgi:hypothetical protein
LYLIATCVHLCSSTGLLKVKWCVDCL